MKIKITKELNIKNADNLIVGNVYETISCPDEYKDEYINDVWVKGVNDCAIRLDKDMYKIEYTKQLFHVSWYLDENHTISTGRNFELTYPELIRELKKLNIEPIYICNLSLLHNKSV